jgi:hypothetical protein
LKLKNKVRVSHVEPVSPTLRWLFHFIRKRVKDESHLASFTRFWPCLWQARIFDGPILGPYKTRKQAIEAEIHFIETCMELSNGQESK